MTLTLTQILSLNPSCIISNSPISISREEQETHISEDLTLTYATTSKPSHITKFFAQHWKPTKILFGKSNNIIEAQFEAPTNSFTIKNIKPTKKRVMTEEHKEKLKIARQNSIPKSQNS